MHMARIMMIRSQYGAVPSAAPSTACRVNTKPDRMMSKENTDRNMSRHCPKNMLSQRRKMCPVSAEAMAEQTRGDV